MVTGVIAAETRMQACVWCTTCAAVADAPVLHLLRWLLLL